MKTAKPLSDCKPGEKGLVQSISPQSLEVSLLAMGLLIGDEVEVTHRAPLGGPIALRINGNRIALRRSEAAHILVLPA